MALPGRGGGQGEVALVAAGVAVEPGGQHGAVGGLGGAQQDRHHSLLHHLQHFRSD